ncbi:MAG: hypothetical protein KC503_04720 [Myxococcales bacterium]|nr:hypothetical protein [Myxococcales bacterium]
MRKGLTAGLSLMALIALGAACSDSGAKSDATVGDGQGSGGDATSSQLRCNNNAPFGATYSRSCTSASDCVAVSHTINCCGSAITIGINKADKAAFEAAEKTCAASWPGCGCPSGPTMLDDGSSVLGASPVGVTCEGGRCTTYVEACGKPCPAAEQCYGCANGPTTTFACSASCTSKSDCTDAAKAECATGIGGVMFCNDQPTCNAP